MSGTFCLLCVCEMYGCMHAIPSILTISLQHIDIVNLKFDVNSNMLYSADCSMYHSLGYGTILYIQAVMTFDMVSNPCHLL